MAILNPYKRIYRPMVSGNPTYLIDSNYSPNRFSFIHSYQLIEKDLRELFDYVSPNDNNLTTFSHRIYELFFRCCTEFENNAKAILDDNGYTVPAGRNMRIDIDYYKINSALKLHEYEIRLNIWDNNPKILKPFLSWNGATYSALTWYQEYNSVKHNRSVNFHLANLNNLINAASGLLIVLYAQYAYHVFSAFQITEMISVSDDNFETSNDCIFEIKPANWANSEKYDFDWNTLKFTPSPFVNFTF